MDEPDGSERGRQPGRKLEADRLHADGWCLRVLRDRGVLKQARVQRVRVFMVGVVVVERERERGRERRAVVVVDWRTTTTTTKQDALSLSRSRAPLVPLSTTKSFTTGCRRRATARSTRFSPE